VECLRKVTEVVPILLFKFLEGTLCFPGLVDEANKSFRIRQPLDECYGFRGQGRVRLDDSECLAAARGTAQLDGGDIDLGAIKEGGDLGEVARVVEVPEDESVELAAEAGFETIDFADLDAAAANRPADEL